MRRAASLLKEGDIGGRIREPVQENGQRRLLMPLMSKVAILNRVPLCGSSTASTIDVPEGMVAIHACIPSATCAASC